MGGQPGGPVPIDPQGQPVFAQNWQARALAVTVAAGGLGKWTLDESGMRVNVCLQKIIWPIAIMKNGWPG